VAEGRSDEVDRFGCPVVSGSAAAVVMGSVRESTNDVGGMALKIRRVAQLID